MTSVGLNMKIAPAAAMDAAASTVPQSGGEGDAFAQMMALVGLPAQPSGPGLATLPAAGLMAALVAVQQGGQGETPDTDLVVADPAPEEAPVGVCMIDIDLNAKLLIARLAGHRDDESQSDTPGEGSADGETAETDQGAAESEPAPAPADTPILSLPIAAAVPPPAPEAAPVVAAAKAPVAAPAIQIAVKAAAPKGETLDQPTPDSDADQAPKSAVRAEKPVAAVLPAPLRQAFETFIARNGASTQPESKPAQTAAPSTTIDQPAAPIPAAAAFATSSAIAITQMQTQLAAVANEAAAPLAADQAGETAASPELAIERQLDIAKDSEWLDSLARDIARTAGRDSTLRFRLHPESLGTLHVEVAQSHAGTSVKLTADSEAARAIISDAQPRLIAEARAQGVRIAEAHVGMELGSQHASDQRRQDAARQEAILRTAAGEAEQQTDETQRAADRSAERFA